MTAQSKEKHWKTLQEGFIKQNINPNSIEFCDIVDTSKQDATSQWGWFNALCERIHDGDEIIFDFTHGFRSVPIIFATAINFLQTISEFTLIHAYYGFIDTSSVGSIRKGRIVDLAGFFSLNQWATAAAFFARSADTTFFSELSGMEGAKESFAAFKEIKFSDSMNKLSGIIRNIDVHHASEKALEAVTYLKNLSSNASIPVQWIIKKIDTVFSPLANCNAISRHYDEAYLRSQIQLSHILISHGLYMQAFTTMRELLGSIGMASLRGKYAKANFDSSDGRNKYRYNMAELFLRMCQYPKEKWNWKTNEEEEHVRLLIPFFNRLEQHGLIESLNGLTKKIIDYRNGFDHAWTVVKYPGTSIIEGEAQACLKELESLLQTMFEKNLIFSDSSGSSGEE